MFTDPCEVESQCVFIEVHIDWVCFTSFNLLILNFISKLGQFFFRLCEPFSSIMLVIHVVHIREYTLLRIIFSLSFNKLLLII